MLNHILNIELKNTIQKIAKFYQRISIKHNLSETQNNIILMIMLGISIISIITGLITLADATINVLRNGTNITNTTTGTIASFMLIIGWILGCPPIDELDYPY